MPEERGPYGGGIKEILVFEKSSRGLWTLAVSSEGKSQRLELEPRDDTVTVCSFHKQQRFHCTASHRQRFGAE